MKFVPKLIALTAAVALPFSALHAGEALDRIMSTQTLKIATDAEWPPQSFINDDNEMDGFDVDIAKEIASRLGVEAEFVTPAWDVITSGGWAGRWDISVGSMTPTTARAEVLDFPAVYYYTPASFVVHTDSPHQSVSDLNGKNVGTGTGSTFELYLEHDLSIDAEGVPTFEYQVTPGQIVSYETSSIALDDLKLGDGVRMHAVLTSLPTALEAISNGYPLRVLGDPVFYEPLSAATDRGDAELNAKIADAVESMRADGTLAAISEKWYGVDYTSTN